MKSIITLISIFLLFSCSMQKHTQPFQKVNFENNDGGVVYLYFSQDGISLGPNFTEFGPKLYIDGQKIGLLAVGTYVPLKMKSGTHTIESESGWDYKIFANVKATFKVESGQSKYIEFAIRGESIDQSRNKWTSFLIERTESEAYAKISHCKLNASLAAATQAKINP
ncbi:MAG: DUF2846 domain-containing protein [Chitinophagaceae bacterium]|nr:MAG: DUF2846 domain-containing protein [Chitinophagaceae bacterium]